MLIFNIYWEIILFVCSGICHYTKELSIFKKLKFSYLHIFEPAGVNL